MDSIIFSKNKRVIINLFVVLLWFFTSSSAMHADEKKDLGIAAGEYGAAVGAILLSASSKTFRSNSELTSFDKFDLITKNAKNEILQGRLSSNLIKTTGAAINTLLLWAATFDPEPVSKGIAAAGGWVAKESFDKFGSKIMDEAQERGVNIIARGLKETYSSSELSSMNRAELKNKISQLRIGGQKLRDAFKDDNLAMGVIEKAEQDLSQDLTVAAISKLDDLSGDTAKLKSGISEISKKISGYQKASFEQMKEVQANVNDLKNAITLADEKLNKLNASVAGNTKAISSLSQISYQGWSNQQKLMALNSGMFPDLDEDSIQKTKDQLQAEIKKEELIGTLNSTTSQLSNLTSIAKNIGLPDSTVKTMQQAQVVASSLAQFAAGNPLGAIAGLTSLGGVSPPDPGELRHQALMNFLNQKFEELNIKLNEVIKLQKETIAAIDQLSKDQRQFKMEVMAQLDRIEDAIFANKDILRAVLRYNWQECDTFLSLPPINGSYDIANKDALVALINDINLPSLTFKCYSNLFQLLNGRVKRADWTGDIIDADKFPSDRVSSDLNIRRLLNFYAKNRAEAFRHIKHFIFSRPEFTGVPIVEIARVTTPAPSDETSRQLDAEFYSQEIKNKFLEFDCSKNKKRDGTIKIGLAELLCYQISEYDRKPPKRDQIEKVFSEALISPQSYNLIDAGILLAMITDFAYQQNEQFIYVASKDIKDFSVAGDKANLQKARNQKKGKVLLEALSILSEAIVLQQNFMYGDKAAKYIMDTLYDKNTHSLVTSNLSESQNEALEVMRRNPSLARNVVMLALRQVIIDGQNGYNNAKKIAFSRRNYNDAQIAYKEFDVCNQASVSKKSLKMMFPNWNFEYRASVAEKSIENKIRKGDEDLIVKPYEDCPSEYVVNDYSDFTKPPPMGAGLSVKLADFYVLLPSPIVFSEGIFEYPESFLRSLKYRDKISQALISHSFNKFVVSNAIAFYPGTSKSVSEIIARDLYGKAWNWKDRPNN